MTIIKIGFGNLALAAMATSVINVNLFTIHRMAEWQTYTIVMSLKVELNSDLHA